MPARHHFLLAETSKTDISSIYYSTPTTSTTMASVTTSSGATPRNSSESTRDWTRRNALTPEIMSPEALAAALAEHQNTTASEHSRPSKRRRIMAWFAIGEEGRKEMPGWEHDDE
jgi:hypothetical protein